MRVDRVYDVYYKCGPRMRVQWPSPTVKLHSRVSILVGMGMAKGIQSDPSVRIVPEELPASETVTRNSKEER